MHRGLLAVPIPRGAVIPPLRRVLLVSHGYPPRETAGTEQHVAALAEGLRGAGLEVHVLAATRAPGRPAYTLLEEPGLTRIVNNVPSRPLAQGERDASVEAVAARVEARFRPDLVHVHHVQFLSSGLRFRAPVALTLHDHWAWCAAGGASLTPSGAPCEGPDPRRCAPCAAAWRPREGPVTTALSGAAGALSPWIPPERLHALYLRLPDRLRARARRRGTAPESASAAALRNQQVLAFYRSAALRISPSAHLARQAERHGLGPVEVLPHGVAAGRPRIGGGPILYLGTISRHKGVDLVVQAWREAFPGGAPALALHGAALEPDAALGHPIGAVLDREGVARALCEARLLVLGSRWPENAPLVISEARAAGCPVVAPDIGGVPELVEPGRDGLLYAPGDRNALARALRAAVAAPPGPPRPPPDPAEILARLLGLYARARAGAPT